MIEPTEGSAKERREIRRIKKAIAGAQADLEAIPTATTAERWEIVARNTQRLIGIMRLVARELE